MRMWTRAQVNADEKDPHEHDLFLDNGAAHSPLACFRAIARLVRHSKYPHSCLSDAVAAAWHPQAA